MLLLLFMSVTEDEQQRNETDQTGLHREPFWIFTFHHDWRVYCANVAPKTTGWGFDAQPTKHHKQECHLVRIFYGATTKPTPDFASWDTEHSGTPNSGTRSGRERERVKFSCLTHKHPKMLWIQPLDRLKSSQQLSNGLRLNIDYLYSCPPKDDGNVMQTMTLRSASAEICV